MNFNEWLVKEKGFSERATIDIMSRLKRLKMILETNDIPQDALTAIEKKQEFQELSMCVKSQLRRTTRLYFEYKGK